MRQILKIKALIYLILQLITLYSVILCPVSHAKVALLDWDHLPIETRIKEKLKSDNAVYCTSKVESSKVGEKEMQDLKYFIVGLHEKNCRTALSKLSQYERYQEFISFVKKSSYDEAHKRIRLHLGHVLMPFDMILDFELPRISSPGTYPFSFDAGFLKGLKGEITISRHNNRCLFATTAHWSGPKSKIPDQMFSFFSQALGKKAMETLFRISLTR